MLPDPLELLRGQLRRDRERTRDHAGLYEHKVQRMRASPLAFLRGTAPFFYELLARAPALAAGPAGEGWIVGDLHLENFGAYRTEAPSDGRADVVFHLNDFDDTLVAPVRFDVLRLVTSVILAGRELGAEGPRAVDLADVLLDAHAERLTSEAPVLAAPAPVARLVARVGARSRKQLLEARTQRRGRGRVLARGTRYRDVEVRLRERAARAFADFAAELSRSHGIPPEHLEVLDVAFRVAGTGSLGTLRLAVLVRGKGDPFGAWLFDMKEQGSPSAGALVPRGRFPADGAERVLAGMSALLERPPRLVGRAVLGDRSMVVRRLSPQEDKLALDQVKSADLPQLAAYLGALTGAAHRRSVRRLSARAWGAKARRALLEQAIVLAGLHEAAYLALGRWG